METDLSIRLHLYATAAERLARGGTPLCADAISCWRSATASVSAGIICSHTRVLRGDAEPDPALPGQDDLDILIAGKPGKAETLTNDAPAGQVTGEPDGEQVNQSDNKQRHRLPLHPGKNTVETLALGATGVLVIKSRNV